MDSTTCIVIGKIIATDVDHRLLIYFIQHSNPYKTSHLTSVNQPSHERSFMRTGSTKKGLSACRFDRVYCKYRHLPLQCGLDNGITELWEQLSCTAFVTIQVYTNSIVCMKLANLLHIKLPMHTDAFSLRIIFHISIHILIHNSARKYKQKRFQMKRSLWSKLRAKAGAKNLKLRLSSL